MAAINPTMPEGMGRYACRTLQIHLEQDLKQEVCGPITTETSGCTAVQEAAVVQQSGATSGSIALTSTNGPG